MSASAGSPIKRCDGLKWTKEKLNIFFTVSFWSYLFLPFCCHSLYLSISIRVPPSPLSSFDVCFVAGRTSNRSLCDLRHLRLFNCLLNWLIWKTTETKRIEERIKWKKERNTYARTLLRLNQQSNEITKLQVSKNKKKNESKKWWLEQIFI